MLPRVIGAKSRIESGTIRQLCVYNYLDRVFRGYVVDFVHLKHWPVFNVADVYVTVGGFAFLAWAFLVKRRRDPPVEQTHG